MRSTTSVNTIWRYRLVIYGDLRQFGGFGVRCDEHGRDIYDDYRRCLTVADQKRQHIYDDLCDLAWCLLPYWLRVLATYGDCRHSFAVDDDWGGDVYGDLCHNHTVLMIADTQCLAIYHDRVDNSKDSKLRPSFDVPR